MLDFGELDRLKAELDALRPLPRAAVERLRDVVLIEWTYHSNAIEGSALTLRETQLVVQHGLTVKGKTLRDVAAAAGHADAVKFVESIAEGSETIDGRTIKEIHNLCMRRSDPEIAGKYRAGSVRITGTEYIPPDALHLPHLMDEFVKWIHDMESKIHPVEFAAHVHTKFVRIHPFQDGNGRVARLLMNLTLIRHGFVPAIIKREDRADYYDSLEMYEADSTKIVELVLGRVEDGLRKWLDNVSVKKVSDQKVNGVIASFKELLPLREEETKQRLNRLQRCYYGVYELVTKLKKSLEEVFDKTLKSGVLKSIEWGEELPDPNETKDPESTLWSGSGWGASYGWTIFRVTLIDGTEWEGTLRRSYSQSGWAEVAVKRLRAPSLNRPLALALRDDALIILLYDDDQCFSIPDVLTSNGPRKGIAPTQESASIAAEIISYISRVSSEDYPLNSS